MEETGKNPIQVAERLFQVIERLAENGPMGIMDLSAELGFHKSTTHRLVTSLQYMGYIRQDEESLKYALSLKFLEIGSKILEQTNMASLIHPSLKKLSEQTGETVHLVRREGTEAVYIDKVSPQSARSAWCRELGAGSRYTAPVSAKRCLRNCRILRSKISGTVLRSPP